MVEGNFAADGEARAPTIGAGDGAEWERSLDEVSVLREAAGQLRSLSVRLEDPSGNPLAHALKLARSDRTWKGNYADNIGGALAHQECVLSDLATGLRTGADWLDRMADEREAAARAPLPGGLPLPPGAP